MKRITKVIILLICIVLIISVALYFINKRNKENEISEYEPQEEISSEQQRETLVSLYFINKTTKEVEPEARLIDVRELVNKPYETLMKLLIAGPKNDNLETNIPENTKINSITLSNDILIIDFSTDFTEISGKDMEEKTIETIVKTMTELTEVNQVKIFIDGEENKAFKDNEVMFNEIFIREE